MSEKVGGLEPASSIIDRLGGPKKVADELKLHRTRVSKWKLPKVSGGTGGTVPAKHIHRLMKMAARDKIELKFSEFFLEEPELDLPWIDVEGVKRRLKADGFRVCECTEIEQDESCPVGYPSLLCDVCNGKGFVRDQGQEAAE